MTALAAPAANLVNLEDGRGSRTAPASCSTGCRSASPTATGSASSAATATARRRCSRCSPGCVPPDAGRVTHTGGLRVGLLAQDDRLDRPPGRCADRRGRRPARPRLALGRRGPGAWSTSLLGPLDLDGPVGPLSGGERRRVALAALLVDDPDLLAARRADQPPRRRGRRLAGPAPRGPPRRARRRHPRPLVPRRGRARGPGRSSTAGCTRTTAATRRTCSRRPSGARAADADEARRQNLLRKELAWLRRGPPARTSKPKFRIDAANALIADEPPPRDTVELLGSRRPRLGRSVYDVEDATRRARRTAAARRRHLAARPRRPGRHRRRQRRRQDDAAAAARRASSRRSRGRVRVGRTVRPAYLSQEVAELPASLRVLEAVEEVAPGRRPRARAASSRRASWSSGSASPATGRGPRSATCPAASGGGCSCCGC